MEKAASNNNDKNFNNNNKDDTASFSCYVGWDEVWVCGEKGRREVKYYLKKKDGSRDLAVVGKEKSLRHMSYCFYYCNNYNNNSNNSNMAIGMNVKDPIVFKLKSRREVIHWLNSIVSVSDVPSHQAFRPIQEYVESKDSQQLDVDNLKNVQMSKMGWNMSEFTWLGSSWTCRKKRRHYQSFWRNGVHIYVHDFVYVLAEEDNRLVAYLEDMYEDSRGNKMVVVRWFHKIDEVGIVLPHTYNDREIFFSLCLQDLSIECIDGLATVLCPQHYEKFLNEARHTQLEPFVCHMQFENDDVKPFDITQVKGYWKQDVLRYMSSSSPSKDEPSDDGLKTEGNHVDAVGSRPMKRLRRSKESDEHLQPNKLKSVDSNLRNQNGNMIGCEGNVETVGLKEGCLAPSFSGKDAALQKHLHYLTIGSQVEVLSQDSGLRGCWFRALIVKKHKDKVKVQYQDIKDAADEAKNLEEWVLASRLAAVDECGIRIYGRTIVRPIPSCNKGGVSCGVNVGSIVDAWWHDGWWEGIVVEKESEDRLHVYFPGEKQELAFGRGDLRYSLEWLDNGWNYMKERPDLVSILSQPEPKKAVIECSDVKPDKAARCDGKDVSGAIHRDGLCQKNEVGCGSSRVDAGRKFGVVRDLSKDYLLAQLRWKSSGKRRVVRSPIHKVHYDVSSKKNGAVDTRRQTSERFLIRSSLKVDPDYCKYASDSLYSSSDASHLTSLVLSR